MADTAAQNQVLGYSVYQQTTKIIEDYVRNILEDDFQYLNEILAEVTEHFGRRESVILLPKTPCMKGKRKRLVRSLDEFLENEPESSPEKGKLTTAKDSFGTPESKKPAICTESPEEIVEPKKHGAITRSKVSKLKKHCEDEVEARERRKSRTKEPKKSKRQRGTRSSSKQVVKDSDKLDDVVQGEASPKELMCKNKRKKDESAVTPVKTSVQNGSQKESPVVCMAKKSKLSVTPAKEMSASDIGVEVFIPETPIIEPNPKQKCPLKSKPVKFSSIQVLEPTSTIKQNNGIESLPKEAEKRNVVSSPLVIVEEIAYECQQNIDKTPEQVKVSQEQVIRESTVSSTNKNDKRETRSRGSSRGTKRKQDEVKDPGVMLPAPTIAVEVDSDHAVVSSTVESPVKKQRKSTGNRRSSRLSMKTVKNQVKSKIIKSRTLVKSSVVLKLSTKKATPNLSNKNVDSEGTTNGTEFDSVKTKLFDDQENKEEVEPFLQICEAHSSTPSKSTDTNPAGYGKENAKNEETEDEEFHDAPESIEEVDCAEYHDAIDTNKTAADEKDAISREKTDSPSGTESKDPQISDDGDYLQSSGSGSQSPLREDKLHPSSSENESDKELGTHEEFKDNGNYFGTANKVIKYPAGVIHSFIKRNTPKKIDSKEKSRRMKMAILEKEEKEKERIEQLELLKQRRIEAQKRRREEKERKAAELRAARARAEREKREQMEKKMDMRKQLEDKLRKEKEKEEEIKRKARQQKRAELDARRKQEEEQRMQKIQEKEDEATRYREMLRRKAEYEEQERQRKIMEAKMQQEQKERELEKEREQNKLRLRREIEEKERKAKEEREKAEKKVREEKEKEEKERKRIAQLLKEKEENERKERERQAREEKVRKERERKYREEREASNREELEKERQRQRHLEELRLAEEARLRVLQTTDSYDMTPPPPPRVRSITSAENYNIDDICSDDSTDDEEAPKKRIPTWAQGAKLKAALINQSMGKFDVEAIFGRFVEMPDLDQIFTYKKKKRFYQRTSSAHWDSPPLRTLNNGSKLI